MRWADLLTGMRFVLSARPQRGCPQSSLRRRLTAARLAALKKSGARTALSL